MYSVRQLLWKSKIEVKATSTHFKIDEVLVVIVLQLCNCTNAFIKWLCRLVCKLSLQKAWHTSRRTSKYKSTQTLATTKNISINPWRTQTSAKEKLNKKLLSAAKSIYRAQTCNTLSDTCEAVLAKAGAASVCEAHKVMDRVVTQSHLEPLPDVFTPFPKILSVTRLYLPAVHQLLPCFSLLHFCVHSISRNFVGNIWRKWKWWLKW